MKIWKFMGKRGFAVFTSLALCASLVAPTFAASFTDLNNAIKGEGDWKQDAFGISTDDNGNRKITLIEDVTRDSGEGGIMISGQKNITLDLNGKKIDGNKDSSKKTSIIEVNGGGTLIIQDQTAHVDEDGNYVSGTITGGIGGKGGGVYVNGGSVTLDSGKITGNETNANYGGGVYVTNGTFKMTGGEISDNTAHSSGGGVGIEGSNASFTMKGGKITGNTANNKGGDGGGGGVWIKSGATFTMINGEITGNTVTRHEDKEANGKFGNGGGVAIHQATFTMEGGKIYDNHSPRGTGVLINSDGGNAEFTMEGGYVSGDKNTSCIFMEEGTKAGEATLTLQGEAVLDGSIFLGQGAQVITDNVMQPDGTHPYTSFDVTDTAGNKVDTSSITGIEGSTTIGPDQTGIEKGSYQCDTQDLLLDIQYDHDFGKDWSSDGEKTHSHHCEYCSETSGTTGHNWDGGKVTKQPTRDEKGVRTFTCTVCGATKTEEISFTGGGSGGGGTFIEDVEVPLAGLFTRADAIGYLWEQAGSPDAELSTFADVPEDHQWAVAIGWAQDVGIALPDLEGSFRPDDLVLRSVEDIELSPEGELEEFLNRYAVYAGIELDAGELFIELAGEWDDVIMGEEAQVIFDDFFVKLELALAQAA